MPGIYGFSKSKTLFGSCLSDITAAVKYEQFIKDSDFEDENIAASRVHLGIVGESTTPVSIDHCHVWVEGEAYNAQEVSQQLNLKAESLGNLLAEAYLKDKLAACLNRLDGYFCAALYDKNNKQIKLISDRYGMRALFWYMRDGGFAWGSEVKSILACKGVRTEVDEKSCECFISLGHFLGEDTWFKDIRLIKPATILTYDITDDVLEHEYYWKWSEIKPSELSFEQAVDELGIRFGQAVKKRISLNDEIGVSLSGGLDSRALIAALKKEYPDKEGYAFTFGIPGCDDIDIAQRVTERAHWQHDKFYFNDRNWFQPRINMVKNTDGLKDMKHMHGGEFLGIVSNNARINLSGYLGDAIFGCSYHRDKSTFNKSPDMEIVSKYYGDYLESSFLDDFYNIDHIEPILFMSRGRRFINMGLINTLHMIEQRVPFFDNTCVELIFSLPDEYREDNKLYSAMLQKYYPNFFNDIPWQKTGVPIGVKQSQVKVFAKRVVSKVNRTIRALLGLSSAIDYTDYNMWIRSEAVSKFLKDLLDPTNAEYSKVTKVDFLNEFLMPHLESRMTDNSDQVLRAATMEIYLRQVKGNKLPDLNTH
ncbi:asparagine synthase-related protein [Vibrio mediterranei]|uniref:asparagine synthase (glutamine-hydrolyzing) n=1 Tax=Vibrio mediterranei TaxID=689 RepID=A0AAN1KM98_9VIBR|nr:asparagine synthase-related protein [Vibrio mediterranei]ASI89219.1 hypothetical protein BSZ05_05030 [Vibrio mediterranei]